MATTGRAKRGNMRKSVRRRLPTSSGSWGTEFAPTDDEWFRIERAYGRAIDGETRARIINVVKDYLLHEPFERNAPFVDDAIGWLDKVEGAAATFWRATFEAEDGSNREAMWSAQSAIEAHIRSAGLGESSQWHELVRIMTDVVAAIRLARRDLVADAGVGLVEGDAWRGLVVELTSICAGKRLPTGASKGLDKTSSDEPSPFVRMFRALQALFPEASRRHQASYMAAAEAISVARRTDRQRKARVAAQAGQSSAGDA